MAHDTLKATIRQYIGPNGQNSITGQIMQDILIAMVDEYPDITGYATQAWVQQQGYVTASALSGYATQAWVQQQGYVTASVLSGYLPLTGGTLTGGIESGSLDTGYYFLSNELMKFEYSDNGPRYAGGINIDVKNRTITWYGRGGQTTGTEITGDNVTSSRFIVKNGTSDLFLKADGSLDSNTYVTASALSGYLPLTGGDLSGSLSIQSMMTLGSATLHWEDEGEYCTLTFDHDGVELTAHGTGYFIANEFIKRNGTSDQFLKADGSVDSNTYITASALSGYATQAWVNTQLSGYLPLTGGTVSGSITVNEGISTYSLTAYTISASSISIAGSGVATQSWVQQQGYITASALSGYATQSWVTTQLGGYLPLTGGTLTGDLAVNGEFNTFSLMQVNGTSNTHPFLRLHIPNVNWARLQMDTDGVIHVLDGSHGTSYNGFACGNLDVNGTLKIATNKSLSFGTSLEIFKVSTTGMLVMKNDEHDIVLGSIGNNFYVSFIEDIQGGTANSDYSMNTVNWGITTAGAATFVSVTQTSDIRRKNIISDIGMAIDDIAQAPMFRFTMKDNDEAIVRVGTSAQYWQTVIPEVVSEDKHGVLGLQYDVTALACAITVAKTVVDHEERIKNLENKILS